MIDRVERLPRPRPNVDDFLAVLRCERPRRVPLFELKLDDELAQVMLDEPLVRYDRNAPPDARRHAIRQYVGLMHRLGYDAIRLRAGVPFELVRLKTDDTAGLSRGAREWQSEHSGPIQTFDDFEQYPWPTIANTDFGPVEEIVAELPGGMACVGFSGGVLEWASWLMGLEPFSIALYDQPGLVRAVVDRVGQLVYDVFNVWKQFDHVVALWCGDDMGFKTATLISPQHLREYILPWHKKYARLAHEAGKPYILHACGNLGEIIPDLVNDIGIDALHSFQDVILPVEEFHRQWCHKAAALGGIDVDLLARGTEQDVASRTTQILEACAPKGAYAAGSGNSVTNYVPVQNYLAMIETVHRFNAKR